MMTKVHNNSQNTKYNYDDSCSPDLSLRNPLLSNQDRGVSSFFLDTLANDWNKGGKLSSSDTLVKLKARAKAKYLTNKYIYRLIDLHSPLEKQYWNTYFCNHVLVQEGKKIYGHYCSNRWCFECNRIRTAKLINGYKPAVESFKDPFYMVLTIKNVPCTVKDLQSKVKEMNKEFRKIIDLIRKRDGLYIEAIRTIEVTYNKRTNELHPHFNIVVNFNSVAEMIRDEWLKHFTKEQVDIKGQFIHKADKGTLKELFKYVCKIDDKTPAFALDIIYQAMRGIKLTAPNGVRKVSEEIEDLVCTEIKELDPAERTWWWNSEKRDWETKNCWPDLEGIRLCKLIEKLIKNKSP